MTLTQKEQSLLTDLKSQEALCIEKYEKYAAAAADPVLQGLFSSIKSTEQGHLSTIEDMMAGKVSTPMAAPSAVSQSFTAQKSSCTPEQKQADAYLCKDALAMEKHVSSCYDISVFEFTAPAMRDTLSHIQKEEQNHGQQLYQYLSLNGMYS